MKIDMHLTFTKYEPSFEKRSDWYSVPNLESPLPGQFGRCTYHSLETLTCSPILVKVDTLARSFRLRTLYTTFRKPNGKLLTKKDFSPGKILNTKL